MPAVVTSAIWNGCPEPYRDTWSEDESQSRLTERLAREAGAVSTGGKVNNTLRGRAAYTQASAVIGDAWRNKKRGQRRAISTITGASSRYVEPT